MAIQFCGIRCDNETNKYSAMKELEKKSNLSNFSTVKKAKRISPRECILFWQRKKTKVSNLSTM